MTITSIEALAQREARAEHSKGKADKEWRRAWWATTLALGAIPAKSKAEVGAAQEAVRTYTGQSVAYVKRRTGAGRFFGILKDTETLPPPRMALAVMDAQNLSVTPELVERMIKAEADGIGLREFVVAETGHAWADTPEGASDVTIAKIVEAQPDKVAKAVASNPRAAVKVSHAIKNADKHAVRPDPDYVVPKDGTPITPTESIDFTKAAALLAEARGILRDAIGLLSDAQSLDIRPRNVLRGLFNDSRAACDAGLSILDNGTVTEAAEAILRGAES